MNFVESLDKKDLQRLRVITNRAAMAKGGAPLTDFQCDIIIDELGPEIVYEHLRHAVNNGLVD